MSKIKLCFITSIPGLSTYAQLSNMHMSLAHLVVESDEYATFYKWQGHSGNFVIMDNSAFEFESQGRGVPQDMVIEAANKINPNEICVADMLFDGKATIEAVDDFMKFVKKYHPYLIGNVKFMAIPQGNSEDEWLDCYEALVTRRDINTIGFSKLSIPESFYGNHKESFNCTEARIKVCDFLVTHNMEPYRFDKETHLLGSDNGGVSELRYYYHRRYNDWIRSNDTSMPFVYGLHKKKIDLKSGKVSNIILDKLDFDAEYNNEQMQCIDHNMIIWRTADDKQ